MINDESLYIDYTCRGADGYENFHEAQEGYRFTNGRAAISIAGFDAKSVRVYLQYFWPGIFDEMPDKRVSLLINGELKPNSVMPSDINPYNDAFIFDDVENVRKIEIISEAWTPCEVNPESPDVRKIGIAFVAMKIDRNSMRAEMAIPAGEYRSCDDIESGLTFTCHGTAAFCCVPSTPLYPDISKESEFDVDRYLRIRAASRHSPLPGCAVCKSYKTGKWAGDGTIRRINVGLDSICNFRCEYCATTQTANFRRQDQTANGILRHVENLHNRNLLSRECLLNLASGEPALLKGVDELIAFFLKIGGRIHVDSNCSIYKESFAEALRSGRCAMTCSVDAGTEETFRKVKGANCFDAVIENMRKYSEAGRIQSKYVICDSNCTVNEISAHVKKMHDIGIETMCFDFDFRERLKDGIKGDFLKCMALGKYIIDRLRGSFEIGMAVHHHAGLHYSLNAATSAFLNEFDLAYDRAFPENRDDFMYSLGTKMTFAAGHDERFRAYCCFGLSPSEDRGAWTDGDSAMFRFRFVNETDKTFVLRAEANPFIFSPGGGQKAILFVNGQYSDETSLKKMGVIRLRIPRRLRKADGEINTLTMNFPNSACPSEVGCNDDKRKLGIQISTMAIC